MSKTKNFFKLISFLVLCAICINFCSVISYAANPIKWSLVRTNGPSSEWVTKRNYTFIATQNKISINCKESNTAVVHAQMTNKTRSTNYLIHGHMVSGSVLSTTKALKGTAYTMEVSYENYGTGYNNPYGYINY